MKTEVPSCCAKKNKPWYKEPLYIVIGIIGITFFAHLLLAAAGWPILAPVWVNFFEYICLTWWAIGLGLIIGALIDILVPEELMVRWLAQGKKSIFLAVGLGFLASACSHGILAIAVSLYKKGASTAATFAFLLAAPWANLAITILLFALFGPKALLIIGGAIIIAIISGLVFQVLTKKGLIEDKNQSVVDDGQLVKFIWPGVNKLTKGVMAGVWTLTKMVVWWVLVGFFVSSIIGAFVPEMIFHKFFGPSILGMLATLGLASVIEVCSEGSAPMAFELFQKTGAFGNTFVFLQAGVVTDFTEFGLIWSNIGKRAAIALVSVTVPLTLLLGFLFNNLMR